MPFTDRELAEKMADILSEPPTLWQACDNRTGDGIAYYWNHPESYMLTEAEFINDWRVTGPLMERYMESGDFSPHYLMEGVILRGSDSVIHAINKICVSPAA